MFANRQRMLFDNSIQLPRAATMNASARMLTVRANCTAIKTLYLLRKNTRGSFEHFVTLQKSPSDSSRM